MTSTSNPGAPGRARSPRHDPHQRFGSPLRNLVDVWLVNAGLAAAGPKAPLSSVAHLRESAPTELGSGANISYLRAGNPFGPCIVMVHGSPGCATSWADYLLAPPPGAEVVAVDRPGFGHSLPHHAVPSLADQARALHALLPPDDRPLVLLGHSLGGAVVTWLAAVQPRRVKAIVLLASSLDQGLEAIHPMQRLADSWPLRGLLPRAIRNSNTELLRLRDELTLLRPMLSGVLAKVVIAHGTRDDLVPVANTAFMQRQFTGARAVHTELLDGHNHFLPWNSSSQVRTALRLALEPAC